MALFELACTPAFDCTRIVACLERTADGIQDMVRNLGWVGYELSDLEDWTGVAGSSDVRISDRWLFLAIEV